MDHKELTRKDRLRIGITAGLAGVSVPLIGLWLRGVLDPFVIIAGVIAVVLTTWILFVALSAEEQDAGDRR